MIRQDYKIEGATATTQIGAHHRTIEDTTSQNQRIRLPASSRIPDYYQGTQNKRNAYIEVILCNFSHFDFFINYFWRKLPKLFSGYIVLLYNCAIGFPYNLF